MGTASFLWLGNLRKTKTPDAPTDWLISPESPTWCEVTGSAIGGDLMRAVEEDGGHAMKQDEVIEAVFDANYMQIYGGDKEAEAYTHKLNFDELMKLGKKIFPHKSYS